MKPLQPMKLFLHSITSSLVIVTTIHYFWYIFQKNYVPKDQQAEIPILVMLRRFIKKDNSKKPDDTN